MMCKVKKKMFSPTLSKKTNKRKGDHLDVNLMKPMLKLQNADKRKSEI